MSSAAPGTLRASEPSADQLLGSSLAGERVLVTGAGRGLGRSIAIGVAAAGADVVLAARTADQLQDTARVIRRLGVAAYPHACDVTDPQQVAELVSADGPAADVSVLINCAGSNVPEPFVDVDLDTFDRILGINLRATFLVTQAVVTNMLARGSGGVIVNITSQMGHVGAANRSVYCASKHAVEGLTKALAVELGPHNIRVNSVAPTFIDTDMTRGYLSDSFRDSVLAEIPLGRLGSPQDVAAAVTFLASPAAALVTGTSLRVDGGWTAH
jgi:NAD(P)-dependent dehydrogenase (short-subunit alcohol dehydrogenase family)